MTDTYWCGNEETGEQIEKIVEGICQDYCHLEVRCHGHDHHPVVCEVEKGKEVHKEEPKEFCGIQFKAHHEVYYYSIICRLEKNVRYFCNNLQMLVNHQIQS